MCFWPYLFCWVWVSLGCFLTVLRRVLLRGVWGVCWCCLLGSFVVGYCLMFKSTPFVFVNSVDTRFLCGLLGAGGCL